MTFDPYQRGNLVAISEYSHSKLNDFELCPLKFKFKHLDRIKTDFQTIESFKGDCVHEALKILYERLAEGCLCSLCDLLDLYEERWERAWSPNIRVVRGFAKEDFEGGADCIENYYRACYPFADSRTEALEEGVRFPLNLGWRGTRLFAGKIDRLASKPDGTYAIHDYKTGKLRQDSDAKNWRQLTLYQCAIQFSHPEIHSVELVLHYLEPGGSLFRQQTNSEIAEILADVRREIIYIESQESFAPNPSPLCDWCEFREDCPVWS